ncbi:hypothetical protein [Actinomadura atramentaria]|uniref:hypothetical protein n=1 Tax=Actinomadura atramentaria TaxID=1990 RepID=UPI000376CB11|nr:hypothetical protein [Actinomadura atramentaria]
MAKPGQQPGYRTYTPPGAPQRDPLATAALTLGIVGLAGLSACLLGLLPAAVGLVLGAVALRRGGGRRRAALAGVACSAAALVIGGVLLALLLGKAAKCGDRDPEARERCVQREFPFIRDTSAPGT